MIKLKTPQDIELLRAGGAILASVISQVAQAARPGVGTQELDSLAAELIARAGATSSFKGYRPRWAATPFPGVLCLSLNNEVVHGLPVPNRLLKSGDIIGIDCGIEYRGRYTDMAVTVPVGHVSAQAQKLIQTAEAALLDGIAVAAPGVQLSVVSSTIQHTVEKQKFGVVRELVGHGVGFSAHEDPQVPNFVDRSLPDLVLQPGMVLAIEPMITVGHWSVQTLGDGWTIATADGSLAAHAEHTVAITDEGAEILTLVPTV